YQEVRRLVSRIPSGLHGARTELQTHLQSSMSTIPQSVMQLEQLRQGLSRALHPAVSARSGRTGGSLEATTRPSSLATILTNPETQATRQSPPSTYRT